MYYMYFAFGTFHIRKKVPHSWLRTIYKQTEENKKEKETKRGGESYPVTD